MFDSDLGAIGVPPLIVADRGDTCLSTPAPDANTIAAALTSLAGAQRVFESQEPAYGIDLVGLGLSAVMALIDRHASD